MIIGFAGKARAGKDTAREAVERYFERTATKVVHKSYAAKLKKSATEALGIVTENPPDFCDRLKDFGEVTVRINDEVYGPYDHTISGREYLQNYGTEAHRDVFGKDFWVDAALPMDSDHHGDIWVFTDVRFENEAQRIRELGGYVIEIEREGSGAGTHASEKPLPRELVDATVDNNGTLVDLDFKIKALVGDILNHKLSTDNYSSRDLLGVAGV